MPAANTVGRATALFDLAIEIQMLTDDLDIAEWRFGPSPAGDDIRQRLDGLAAAVFDQLRVMTSTPITVVLH